MNAKREHMSAWWEEGVRAGWIGQYEKEMVRMLEAGFGILTGEMKLCAVFVSLFLKAGHTCLPLDKKTTDWAVIAGLNPDETRDLPKGRISISDVEKSSVVGNSDDMKPFILEGKKLSFRKYKIQEDFLVQWIKEKTYNSSLSGIGEYISSFFPETDSREIDWQKTAAVLSLVRPFLIISGGPGTGKTTTVARVLALQQALANRPLNIALAAPTGKAAGRMGEALFRELSVLEIPEDQLQHFPKEAKTVHRLLTETEEHGLLPPVEKKYLLYDLVVVDEASMIDLDLMFRLVRHLGKRTKLILLGDKDQLASVEAGSVFADLCQKSQNGFRRETLRQLKKMGLRDDLPETEQQNELSDSLVYLTKSYRFGPDSGIGRLANLVQTGSGDSETLEKMFRSAGDLHYREFRYQREDIEFLLSRLTQRMEQAASIRDPEQMLAFWKKTAWLGVLRRGLTGTDRLNQLAEQQLVSRRLVTMEHGWYHGRPVIVTQNDYNLGIFNGDLGVCLQGEDGMLRVYVESGSALRSIRPQRLSAINPAYFLTVHKSQGSEFDSVNLLLPATDNALVTRELLYTAITRSRKEFSLFGDLNIFVTGLNRSTERYTGLKDRLN